MFMNRDLLVDTTHTCVGWLIHVCESKQNVTHDTFIRVLWRVDVLIFICVTWYMCDMMRSHVYALTAWWLYVCVMLQVRMFDSWRWWLYVWHDAFTCVTHDVLWEVIRVWRVDVLMCDLWHVDVLMCAPWRAGVLMYMCAMMRWCVDLFKCDMIFWHIHVQVYTCIHIITQKIYLHTCTCMHICMFMTCDVSRQCKPWCIHMCNQVRMFDSWRHVSGSALLCVTWHILMYTCRIK